MNPFPIPPDTLTDIVRYVLIPIALMLSSYVLQRWIKSVLEVLKRLEEFVSALNRVSLIILLGYFTILVYLKFGR